MGDARMLPWLSLILVLLHAKAAFAISVKSTSLGSQGDALVLLRGSRSIVNMTRQLPFTQKEKKDKRVMDAISKFRAEICAKMKKEHGVEFASYESCVKFMEGACRPGKDKLMDGDRKETTSGEGYCEEYFDAKKKAEKQIADEDAAAAAAANATSPGPAPGASPGPAPGPAVSAGASPAPGPFGAPAGPAPAPFIPGVSPGKPPGPLPKDEAWYYKNNSKDMGRLHMDEKKKLPTEGYWGKLVEHEDEKTATGDWMKEFGMESSDDSFEAFCKKHPTNPWCETMHPHSSAHFFTASATLLLVVIAVADFSA